MILTDGTGHPPAGWNAEDAAERIRRRAHARPEHAAWLAETDDNGELVNPPCAWCEGHARTGPVTE